jgi:hypothetical protein
MSGRSSASALPTAIVAAVLAALLSLAFVAPADALVKSPPPPPPSEPPTLPCFALCEPPPEVEPDLERSILLLTVGWNSGLPSTSTGLDQHELGAYANYISGHVNDWYTSQAPGVFRPWSVTAAGEFMIPGPVIESTDPSKCNDATLLNTIRPQAEAVARQAGFEPSHYAVMVITWQNDFCGVSNTTGGHSVGLSRFGLAPMRGLSQFLGVYPADAQNCFSGGVRVPLSGNCSLVRDGDPYDSLGSGSGAANAEYTQALGWLGSQFFDINAGLYSQTFNLKPWTGAVRQERALRLRDGGTFWLEYRRPVGIDAPGYNSETVPVTAGLLIRQESQTAGIPPFKFPVSMLLDMTPQTAGFADAPLAVGQTWANPLGWMQIRLDSADSQGATVTISSQTVPVPTVAGLSRSAATNAIQKAGLVYAGSINLKVQNCENIGKAIGSTPNAGTLAPRGSGVIVTIAEADPKHPCP